MAPIWHVRGAAGLEFEVIGCHETAKAVCANPDDRTYNCNVVRLTVWVPEFSCFGINKLEMVSRIFASWNQLDGWLRQVECLRLVA